MNRFQDKKTELKYYIKNITTHVTLGHSNRTPTQTEKSDICIEDGIKLLQSYADWSQTEDRQRLLSKSFKENYRDEKVRDLPQDRKTKATWMTPRVEWLHNLLEDRKAKHA